MPLHTFQYTSLHTPNTSPHVSYEHFDSITLCDGNSIPAIHMFLDQESLPRFEKIDVLGILEVDNDAEKSYTLDVTYLYISGQFIAGTERQEFAGSLTINLHGDVSTPEYVIIDPPNSDGINMGAKAIGKNL